MNRLAFLLCLLVFVGACGKNNNFQAVDEPELAVEPGFIRIQMPPDEVRTRSQEAIAIRNTGDGVLKVTRLEFIDRPERLVALGAPGGSCESDADCAANEVCITNSKTCTATGLPEPFELGAQLRKDLEFAITTGPNELPCPEPTIEVPLEYEDDYCGAVRIETNAINDGEFVEAGSATIYFLDPGASGDIVVDPTFLEFANVQPGTMHMQSFSVQNAGMSDLELFTMGVEDFPDFFNIVGETVQVGGVVPPGTSAEFNVTVSIPADATEYETFTNLVIESSAGVAKIAVQITADTGSTPFAELSDTVLKFDAAATQTLTITNSGEATLAVRGVNVSPEARAFYRIQHQGNDVTDAFQTVNVPAGQTLDLDIVFSRPMDNTDPSIGSLEISHNDPNHGFRSEVTLLGDEGDVPIGRLHPDAFTFLAEDGNNAARKFVIRNIGTAPLDLTNVGWNFSNGSNAEFQIMGASGSVPPGGIKEATVTFSGANATPDVGLAVLESNNPTELSLSLRALASSQAQPNPVITVTNQGALRTNAPVNLTAADSMPAGAATNAIWTMISRPASSAVFLDAVGETAAFVPDVAGTYTVALTILQSDREGQTTMDLVVE